MEWTNEKPKEEGLYFRSNPAFQIDITEQNVIDVDGVLKTLHPKNEGCKLTNVEDMPNSFIWLKIPYPPHYKKKVKEIKK